MHLGCTSWWLSTADRQGHNPELENKGQGIWPPDRNRRKQSFGKATEIESAKCHFVKTRSGEPHPRTAECLIGTSDMWVTDFKVHKRNCRMKKRDSGRIVSYGFPQLGRFRIRRHLATNGSPLSSRNMA
jgi:hypothetical protein